MSKIKLILLASTLSMLVLSISCVGETEKGKIERYLRNYVERDLGENESFDFIGSFDWRDTIFMGTNHPCTRVIYSIINKQTGTKTRYSVDIIFSKDYATILCLDEKDFDPIEYSQEKVQETVKDKVIENLDKK